MPVISRLPRKKIGKSIQITMPNAKGFEFFWQGNTPIAYLGIGYSITYINDKNVQTTVQNDGEIINVKLNSYISISYNNASIRMGLGQYEILTSKMNIPNDFKLYFNNTQMNWNGIKRNCSNSAIDSYSECTFTGQTQQYLVNNENYTTFSIVSNSTSQPFSCGFHQTMNLNNNMFFSCFDSSGTYGKCYDFIDGLYVFVKGQLS